MEMSGLVPAFRQQIKSDAVFGQPFDSADLCAFLFVFHWFVLEARGPSEMEM
jgi:hypothetical protein